MKTPKLVYVVEDDRITAIIMGLIAKKDCRAVQTFDSGQQAFTKLIAAVRDGVGIPNLVLLDLNMPLMNTPKLVCSRRVDFFSPFLSPVT